jgi:hypothetical protein
MNLPRYGPTALFIPYLASAFAAAVGDLADGEPSAAFLSNAALPWALRIGWPLDRAPEPRRACPAR